MKAVHRKPGRSADFSRRPAGQVLRPLYPPPKPDPVRRAANQSAPLTGPALDAPISVSDLLRVDMETAPDGIALVSGSERWTWRALDRATDNLATNLLASGLRQGDRVASFMPNSAVVMIHYVACMKAGLVAVPLNYRYTPPEIDHALEVSGASLLVVHPDRLAEIESCTTVTHLPHGIICPEGEKHRRPSLSKLIADGPANRNHPQPAAGDPAFIFFTSGSTGPAKGVTHSYESFGWMIASGAVSLQIGSRDVILPGSSISHVAAFVFSCLGLSVGARVLIAPNSDGETMLRLLRRERPTMLWMLPSALFSLVQHPDAATKDFASLRLCLSGGDQVPGELQREFEAVAGLPIDEGYGMTEIGLITHCLHPDTVRTGSMGRPAPGMALSVRDDGGREVAPWTVGNLWVRSPSTMLGYWRDQASTAATIRDGWLDTGDLVTADPEGFIYFYGRKKQIIVHDGSNICPQEVEDALLQHKSVASAGVVGVPDLVHGENVLAYVTVRKGEQPPDERGLIAFARGRVGYKAPDAIEFLPDMPLNATGKVDRVTLKRLAAARPVAGGARR